MPLLFDTSVAIALLDADVTVIERRRAQDDAPFLSAVSQVELVPGLFRDERRSARNAERLNAFLEELEVLPFTSREVAAYERIVEANGFSRRLVIDRMIAATALANDLTLATLNPKDFRGISGLLVEDWSD